MLARETNTQKFIDAITLINQRLEVSSAVNLQSPAVHAEDFFARLLNMLYGWQLSNANEDDPNAEAIDLADEKGPVDDDEMNLVGIGGEAPLFVQVTVTCTVEKVNSTLSKKAMRTYAEKGCRVKFVFVGGQRKSIRKSGAIRNPYGVSFDQRSDLLLTENFVEKFKHLDIDAQDAILRLVAKEAGDAWPEGAAPIDPGVVASINGKLEAVRRNHQSFRLLNESPAKELLPKGTTDDEASVEGEDANLISNMGRTVTPAGRGESVRFDDFIRNSWDKNEQQHLFITGKGGIGKTVALLTFATEPGFLPKDTAAVYVPLHRLAKHARSKKDCLAKYLRGRCSKKQFRAIQRLADMPWDRGPNLVLLLDGLNEVPTDCQNQVRDAIAKWAERPGTQVVATSRSSWLGIRAQRLTLEELSREDVGIFLEGKGLPVPKDGDALWKVLRTPLVLKIYSDVEQFKNACGDACWLRMEAPDSVGHLVWNYLQMELYVCTYRSGSPYRPGDYVDALFLVLPYVCWRMERKGSYEIGQQELGGYIADACGYWSGRGEEGRLPGFYGDTMAWLGEESGASGACKGRGVQMRILAQETALLNRGGESFALMHQNFRDCLAALHVRNAMEAALAAVPKAVPGELGERLSLFVRGYLAELAGDGLLGRAWEAHRAASEAEGSTDVVATHNLLGAIHRKRGGDLSDLDWSGMDLSRISLVGYRKEGRLLLSHKASDFDRASFAVGSFELRGHNGSVSSVCFSPDGRLLASGGDDGTVRLWDAATGSPALDFIGDCGDWVRSVCFSPDGRLVAAGSDDGTVRLWDVATGELAMPPMKGHRGRVSSVCFSPDGRLLASGGDFGTVRLWDAVAGERVLFCGITGWFASEVCFSPDGYFLAAGNHEMCVCLWNVATGELVPTKCACACGT